MSFRPLAILIAAVVAALAMAPVASAQATLTLELTGLDEPVEAQVGAEHAMNIGVKLTGSGFVCSQASSFAVALTVERANPEMGFNASIAPASVSFAVPPGAYVQPAAPGVPTSGYDPSEQTASFQVALGDNIPAGHGDHTFDVKAAWDGVAPTGCQANGWPSGVEDTAAAVVTPLFPDGPGTTPGSGENDTDDDDDPKEGPLGAPVLVIGVTLLVIMALRRRR